LFVRDAHGERPMPEVTPANWGFAPHNRWGFRHVQQLFPTCRLANDPTRCTPMPRALQEVLELRYTAPGGDAPTVRQMLQASFTDAFAVWHRGTVVAEYYVHATLDGDVTARGMGPDDHHLLNSVTKSFVGMLAGIAVQQGRLDVEAPLRHYLPDFTGSSWEGTTVRHLLDMTSGVDYGEDYDDANADFWQETSVVGWRPALVTAATPATLREFARVREGKDQADGASFHYRTINTCVLGMVLEAAYRQPLQHLLTDLLWRPLRTRQDASIVIDRAHFPYVGAGMNTCAEDLLRFGAMMVNGGCVDGVQVVPADWIQDTLHGNDAVRAQFASGSNANMRGWHYRNQVWVRGGERPVMFAMGIHGQLIYMDPARQFVAMKFSSQPKPVDSPMWLDTFSAIDAISDYLS
jgi:CubicO group peptidase (beta-lactamase class C family)